MMWIKSQLGAILAGLGTAIIILVGVFRAGRKSKSDEVEAKTAETVLDTVKKGKKIEKINRDIGAKSRRERLRKDASDHS